MAVDVSNKYDRQGFGSPIQFGQPGSSSANAYFGVTACVSAAGGTVTAVVSTALVGASSLILTGLYFTGQGSAQTPFTMGVSTISPGGFFRLQNIGSFGFTGSYSPSVAWAMFNPR